MIEQMTLPGLGDWMLRSDRVGQRVWMNLNANGCTAMMHRESCGCLPRANGVPYGSDDWQPYPESFEALGVMALMIRDSYSQAKAGRPHVAWCRRCFMHPTT